MKRLSIAPDRGDLIWLEFTPHAGIEQAGRRPALVVSPRAYNELTGYALVCPITSRVREQAFEVALPPDSPIAGVVLSDQLRSLDWKARFARPIGQAGSTVVEEVQAKLLTLVG